MAAGGHDAWRTRRRYDVDVHHDSAERNSKEMPIDARVCECCQTSAARTGDGIAASIATVAAEVRDIAIARFSKGVWSQPENLSKDGWQINGCA
jgi:hypothetical protein